MPLIAIAVIPGPDEDLKACALSDSLAGPDVQADDLYFSPEGMSGLGNADADAALSGLLDQIYSLQTAGTNLLNMLPDGSASALDVQEYLSMLADYTGTLQQIQDMAGGFFFHDEPPYTYWNDPNYRAKQVSFYQGRIGVISNFFGSLGYKAMQSGVSGLGGFAVLGG
jgi:hypothetical protein